MRTKLFISAVVFAAMATSCQEQSNNEVMPVIHITPSSAVDDIQTSSFVESAKFIPLETTDESIVGGINGVIIRDSFVYVSSNGELSKFDIDGRFIAKISKRGQGPEEYNSIISFDIDKDGNANILAEQKILVYDWNGNLVKKQECPGGQMARLLPDDSMLLYSGYQDKTRISTIDGSTLENIGLVSVNPSYQSFMCFFGITPMIHYNGGVVLSDFMCDTIYSVSDKGVEYRAVIDFDGKNIPASFFDAGYNDVMEMCMKRAERDFAFNTCFYMESDNQYVNQYIYNGESCFSFVDKASKNCRAAKSIKEDIFLGGYELKATDEDGFFNLIFNNDINSFIAVIEPEIVMEYAKSLGADKEEKIKNDIKYSGINQNAVLYYAKIK